MLYNIYIENDIRHLSLLEIDETVLQRIIAKYRNGEKEIFLNGQKHHLGTISKIKIFTFEHPDVKTEKQLLDVCNSYNLLESNYFGGRYIPENVLEKFGHDITSTKINDEDLEKISDEKNLGTYVDKSRIKEISELKSKKFDFTRLIAILKEINVCHKNKLKFAIPPLVRSVIDQIPPIFGKTNFSEVSGNYGTRSFKESMKILDNSSRKIADSFLHSHITISESALPNETQIDFKSPLDVLLQEIVKITKSENP